jgi:hypothetical protein
MLARKSRGTGSVLAYHGHLLTENCNGLVVSALTTRAYGSAERHAALLMAKTLRGRHRVTLGVDKGYDAHDFVAELRHMQITPRSDPRSYFAHAALLADYRLFSSAPILVPSTRIAQARCDGLVLETLAIPTAAFRAGGR